jgi:hypothetical protein
MNDLLTLGRTTAPTPAAAPPAPGWRLHNYKRPFLACCELTMLNDDGERVAVEQDAAALAAAKAAADAARAEANDTPEAAQVAELRRRLDGLSADRSDAADANARTQDAIGAAVLIGDKNLGELEQELAEGRQWELRLADRAEPLRKAAAEAEQRLAYLRQQVLNDALEAARHTAHARLKAAEQALADAVAGPLVELLAAQSEHGLLYGPSMTKVFG